MMRSLITHRLRCQRLYALGLFMLVALIGLTACRPPEIDLAFATIERQDTAGTGRIYEDKEPGLLVVAQSDDIDQLDNLASPEALSQLRTLDYKASFAVIVFQGWKPTTRYSVQIQRIVRQDSEVVIYTKLNEPEPDEPTGGMVTSPYELAKVDKTGDWSRDITFRVVVSGQSVISLRHFVP